MAPKEVCPYFKDLDPSMAHIRRLFYNGICTIYGKDSVLCNGDKSNCSYLAPLIPEEVTMPLPRVRTGDPLETWRAVRSLKINGVELE